MSVTKTTSGQMPIDIKKKRKYAQDDEIEVRLEAPEPPSKKALRKAKKAIVSQDSRGATVDQDRKDRISDSTNLTDEAQTTSVQEPVRRSDYGIWVGNIAFTTTPTDLKTFFISDTTNNISADEISRVHLPKGVPKFGKDQNKGFAYIDFTNPRAMQEALQLSEKLLSGRRVLIKDARNFEGRPEASKTTKAQVPSSKRIFVGNLGFDSTTEDLKSHFEVCGPISSVHVATFEDSGKCKGYAWIDFEQLPSAESAMRGWVEKSSSDDQRGGKRRAWVNKIEGRKLRMEYAEDKTTRYKKRYGKTAEKKTEEELPLREGDAPADNSFKNAANPGRNEVVTFEAIRGRKERRPRPTDGKRSNRYDDSTIAKLTGSIVEGKGTKLTFD